VSADELPNPDRVATRRFNDPRVAAKRGNPGLWDSTASPLIGARKLAKQYANSDEPMTFPRASGILLHPTSLPGRFGIGDLGDEAYAFADFLVSSGQRLWQVLPLGPTGYGDSPYACYSAFAAILS
jgi:hypothetical protein